MGLVEETDFLLIDQVAYVGSEGTGKSCLAATRNLLLMVPVETQIATGRKLKETLWEINGVPPFVALRKEAEDSDIATFEKFLRSVPSIVSPSILHNLNSIHRLKVSTGFFSRGIYISQKDSGGGWKGYSLKKDEALRCRDFYTGHPDTVF